MEFSEGSSSEILERLSTAYGVETQKQLAEKLGVSAANVSNWVQRDSVPGSAFVKCALDTGCDLSWLANGTYSNANLDMLERSMSSPAESGEKLLRSLTGSGGKTVLKRIMQSYGFVSQKELSAYLGISTGTISTWVRREYFPAEVVITCALDTGISLEWLATGNVSSKKEVQSELINNDLAITIKKKSLIAGRLEDDSSILLDRALLPKKIAPERLVYICCANSGWLVSLESKDISNGLWLLNIDGLLDIYNASRRPEGKVMLESKGTGFECSVSDIKPFGLVVLSFNYFI